ncbi:hypothetical protein F5887DRAFT_1082791 [Amanita rubescens]|nr:hypothetical protein F5887DRAFT_1082791 [Amanita rubescens]
MDKAKDAREAETTYSKATEAELAKNYDAAFRLYIKSANGYLHLSRSAPSDVQKEKWKSSASKALERAEKIKSFVERQKAGASTSSESATGQTEGIAHSASEMRLTPVAVDHFSSQEQFLVLKKGEVINGRTYSPWDEPIVQSLNRHHHSEDDQPSLSSEQLRQSPEWRRPTNSVVTSVCRHVLPQEILQHIVTDCSLCASITVCLEHDRRFKSRLLMGAIYSCQEHSSLMDPCGQYHVRILFNGTWRRIGKICHQIRPNPPHKNQSSMTVYLTTQRMREDTGQIIWPSLIEKAYMKLMGGYEFPGSISSSDLYALVGWIPEHVDVRSPHFERERTWMRLLQGFLSGQCMATVGTGPSKTCSWRGKPLLPSHCYPIVDVVEDTEGPLVTILDSWKVGEDDNHLSESRHLVMPWSDVLSTFDGVYLSWNPEMWPKNLRFHSMWKRRGQDEQSSLGHLRLIFNTALSDAWIWVLLTRHVVNTKQASDYISLRIELEEGTPIPSTRLANEQVLAKAGTFTNGIHFLVKARVPRGAGAFSITASYDGHADEVGYTIDVYAVQSVHLAWDEKVVQPPYTERVTGSFTTKNCGGNGMYPTFMLNPQYHLRLHPPKAKSTLTSASRVKVKTSMVLKTGRNVPVNVLVAWSQGERIYSLSEKELAATSGPYSYGLASITKDLAPGDYSMVVSAFEPHHLDSFTLSVNSTAPFDLRPIPQEGAGMYQKLIKGEWTEESAGGSPSFDKYAINPIYEIESPCQFQLKLRLQLIHPSTTASSNITIYPAPASSVSDQYFKQKHVTTSGPYDDSVCGVATPQVSLNGGKYWAIPSTYIPGVQAEFRLIIYTSVKDLLVQRRTEGN